MFKKREVKYLFLPTPIFNRDSWPSERFEFVKQGLTVECGFYYQFTNKLQQFESSNYRYIFK